MPRFLISYDIAANSKRQKAAKLLKKQGRRLQKSVFLVQASENARGKLQKELLDLLEDDDSLLVFPLCEECYNKAETTDELPEIFRLD